MVAGLFASLKTSTRKLGRSCEASAGRPSPTIRALAATWIVTSVPSRSRRVDPVIADDTSRALDDHLGPNHARAKEPVDQSLRKREATLRDPEENVQRNEYDREEREAATGHAHMIIPRAEARVRGL
jgi:hypothetical protein